MSDGETLHFLVKAACHYALYSDIIEEDAYVARHNRRGCLSSLLIYQKHSKMTHSAGSNVALSDTGDIYGGKVLKLPF